MARERFAGKTTYFAGRPWSIELGRVLDEMLADLQNGMAELQGVPNTPEDIVLDNVGAASAGTGTAPATDDHVHAIPVGDPVGLGNANSQGSSGEVADAAHVHKRDVRVAKAGSDVGTRNRLNFVDGAGITATVADDSGNDEVDVTIAMTIDPADLELLSWVL
jgi:hypothetical protein